MEKENRRERNTRIERKREEKGREREKRITK
jgi:hypothetical protein